MESLPIISAFVGFLLCETYHQMYPVIVQTNVEDPRDILEIIEFDNKNQDKILLNQIQSFNKKTLKHNKKIKCIKKNIFDELKDNLKERRKSISPHDI